MNIFDEPVCLVRTNQNGKLSVIEEVAAQIRDIDKPLVIVAIVGKYRTGKSYLMNRLSGRQTGFPLGSTVESKTKGIWVWCRPHPVKPNCVLMLIDTEGIGDVRKMDAVNNDNSMMTLAMLICSTFVYNILSVFNEDALARLNFISTITGKISTSHFPTFVLAIRDFSLSLEKNGQPITANDYLEEECLREPQSGASCKDSKSSRETIRNSFNTRVCFTFDRPGSRKQLVQLEQLTDDDLDPDFIEQTRIFQDYINEEAPVKMYKRIVVTGEVMVPMLKQFVQEINKGTVPNVENMFRTMVEMKNKNARKLSIACYEELMKTIYKPPLHWSELYGFHLQCMQIAKEKFLKELGQIEPMAIYVEENQIQILLCFSKLEMHNKEEASAMLAELLERMYNDIEEEMGMGRYHRARGHRNYHFHLEKLQDNFFFCTKNLPGNPRKVFKQFIESKEGEEQAIFHSDQKITESERKAEEEKLRAQKLERTCKRYDRQTSQLNRQMDNMQESFEKESQFMRSELQAEKRRLERNMNREMRRIDSLWNSHHYYLP